LNPVFAKSGPNPDNLFGKITRKNHATRTSCPKQNSPIRPTITSNILLAKYLPEDLGNIAGNLPPRYPHLLHPNPIPLKPLITLWGKLFPAQLAKIPQLQHKKSRNAFFLGFTLTGVF
jgi:hypothetical protein